MKRISSIAFAAYFAFQPLLVSAYFTSPQDLMKGLKQDGSPRSFSVELHGNVKNTEGGEVFIAAESVYSMDGDFGPLADLLGVCTTYDAHLIWDEAHSTGAWHGAFLGNREGGRPFFRQDGLGRGKVVQTKSQGRRPNCFCRRFRPVPRQLQP